MDKEEVVELLAGMAKFSPTLWDVVKSPVLAHEEIPIEVEEASHIGIPPWCHCQECREMPKAEERVCCENILKNHDHPLFENHVLTEHNLELAMQSSADYLNFPFDSAKNSSWRHIAYRQYILWRWGKLGRRNRKVIPSCIIWKIRDRFPEKDGNYTGFLDVDYNL